MKNINIIKRSCSMFVSFAMLIGCVSPAMALSERDNSEISLASYTDGDEITLVTDTPQTSENGTPATIAKDGYTAWTETNMHYDGPFPIEKITEGGSFRVEYTASADTKIVLIFSDYSTDQKNWVSVEMTDHGGNAEDGYWTEYSYAACKAKWGEDFSDLKAICVQSWGDYNGDDISATIKKVFWYKGKAKPELSASHAFLGKEMTVETASDNAEYQWYRTDGNYSVAIDGENTAVYTPAALDLGMSLYCSVTSNGEPTVTDTVPVFVSENKVSTTLYSGSCAPDSDCLAAPIYLSQTGYRFNSKMIAAGGKFRVTYTGEANDSVSICFSEWESGKWMEVTPTAAGAENGGYYAEFDYEDIAKLYGNDFSALSAIQVKLPDSNMRVTSLEWTGYDTGEIMHIIPYTDSGEITGVGEQTSVGYVYLKHAGGSFDTTVVKEDGYFYLTYEGNAENKMYLSLTSYSSGDETKAASWATIRPTTYGTVTDGKYWGRFNVSDIRAVFGDNFGRWDHIGFYIDDGLTVKTNSVHLYYVDGTGAEVEINPSDTKWTNKTNKDAGIAFIGDSIAHNPLVNSEVGLTPDKGDWNAILGRDDCDNYGIGGETSEHIRNRFYQLLADDCNYRQIVTLFGINDVGLEANDQMVIDRIINNYTEIFDMVSSSPKKPKDGMFVISLLPSTPATYEGTQERIAKVNDELKKLCDNYDFVNFVNCYDSLLYKGTDTLPGCNTSGEPHGDPQYFMADGLHPLATGYKVIADILNPILGGSYSVSEGVSGSAQSWDFNDGAAGWTYGGDDWSNGGTSTGSMTVENGALNVSIAMNKTNWSQGAVTNWSDAGFDISDKSVVSLDVYLEKSAADAGGGTMLARIYGTNKDDNSTVIEKTVTLSKSSSSVVTIDGKEYYKSALNIGITPSDKKINNLAIMFIGRKTTYNGSILIDNLAFQSKEGDTAVEINGTNSFISDNASGTIDMSAGETGSTGIFNNSGRSGRLYDGATLRLTVKKGSAVDFTGTMKLSALIKDTNGIESTVSTEIDASAFNGTDTAELEMPCGSLSSDNVEYISVKAEAGEGGCNFNDTLLLTALILTNGKASLTSEYSDNGSGGGGGGGGGASYSVKLPHTWTFDKALEGWGYGKGWENDYSGASQSSVNIKDKMMCIKVDFSKDADKSWSQMAASYWNNSAMQLNGGNHASLEFMYDPALQDGMFKVKLYSNVGVDSTSAVDPEKAETVTIGDKEYKKVKLEFIFSPIESSKMQDLGLCIIGVNTSYKGEIYVDNLTIDKGEDIYVNSTKTVAQNNSTITVSGNTLTTASGKKTEIPSEIKLVDGNADENTRRIYSYLQAVGNSTDVLFGQQNNIQNKAGSKSLSESDTYDVVGDYSAIFGIDALALSGNEYNASTCNEKYKTNFATNAAGNVEAAAYLTNKAIENGAIVTLSAHIPNFSIVEEKNTAEKETYAKYDFTGYSPNTLTGDTVNELLPGGKYNAVFNAYLDMIADYAEKVNGAILFRPFHENTGSWFWWGEAFCDPSTFQNVYRYTVEYLRDEKGVHNMLYLYGPGSEARNAEEYAERYPGDSYVDIVGFDMYDNSPDENGSWMQSLKEELKVVSDFAETHNKLVAVTETGAANATAEGDNQTALLKTGNKDKDWFNRILDVVSDSPASYFMVWANFGESDGFYTPYVLKVNSDKTLYGHEMLDNFIDYYNDKRSVFASDQTSALTKVPAANASAVNDSAEGYITAPISGRRVIEETDFIARITNANGTEVQFVLHGDNKDITLDAATEDGLYYTARLTQGELETLGHFADGSAELVVNGESQQTIKLIYNIPEPEKDRSLIDDFDNYYGVNGLLNKAWTLNSTTGVSGGMASISLDGNIKYNGDASMRLDYEIGKDGYAGASISRETDWSNLDAVQLWMIPDGNNQRTVIQITAGGKVYEAYLDECDDFKNRTDAMLVTIPFAEFYERDTKDTPKGGLTNACSKITGAGVWVNAVENDAMKDGMVSGTIWYDAIGAVSSDANKITIESVGNRFIDVADTAWYSQDVEYVARNGIMSGVGGNMFAPEEPLTRAMLVQILYNMEGNPQSADSGYNDVSAGDWFKDAVGWAKNGGIVYGYDDTSFAPMDYITREQMASVLYRYAEMKGYDISALADLTAFTDLQSISVWAVNPMKWANAKELIMGTSDSELSPLGHATRAQASAIIRRFCENVK